MISGIINQKIAEALRAKDSLRVSTLRMLSSALNYERIAKGRELSKEEEIAVVRKEAKKRQEAIDSYKMAGAEDKALLEEKELEILREFLPEDLSDEALSQIVKEVIDSLGAKGLDSFGKVMGKVMKKVAGRADAKKVAELVRARLV